MRQELTISDVCDCGQARTTTIVQVLRADKVSTLMARSCASCGRIQESEFQFLPEDLRQRWFAKHGAFVVQVRGEMGNRAFLRVRDELTRLGWPEAMLSRKPTTFTGTEIEVRLVQAQLKKAGIIGEAERL